MRYLKFYITALFLIMANLGAMAYDPDDLVGSVIGFGDFDGRYFMLYFQDGNIVTFCIGIFSAILLGLFVKKISIPLRIVWVTFTLTLIVLPLILMILGEGINGVLFIIFMTIFYGFFGALFLLSIILVYWIIYLIKCKSLKKSGIAILNLLIKGVGTIPLGYILALGLFAIISQITRDWTYFSQCEKYVQSHYEDYYDIIPLMHQWEKEHTLQWGEKMKRYYHNHENPEPCDTVMESVDEVGIATTDSI